MSKIKQRLAALALSVITMLSSVPTAPTSAAETEALSTNVTCPFRQDVSFEAGGVSGVTSSSYRIPSMVTLADGTIVAAADIRWNTTYDGGGLDTLVARSTDGGVTWSYTAANYLGDNGNEYNGSKSTCFIDPCLTVSKDGKTVYMLVDLYPYGVALNGSGNTPPSTDVGFNNAGYLLLSNNNHSTYSFYLKEGMIYNSSNTPVDGYTVDEYFNIYFNGTLQGNLFYSDSPYRVVRTGFLYLTSSSDGGESWSAPTLLNLKKSTEQVCLVGPGRGLTTSKGVMVFPVYSFHGDNDASSNSQRLSFIYSSDGVNWSRSAEFNHNWASEAAPVELENGNLRFFFRNGTTNLCYVDYNMTSNSWGNAETMTNVDTNSNTQLSAITYSKTSDGDQVILVSCPTGRNRAGDNSSSGGDRLNGSIFVFTTDGGDMTYHKTIEVNSGNVQFMYSCLTERSDGSIAILYEDHENAWGAGTNSAGERCYYTMDMKAYPASDLGLEFDSEVDSDTPTGTISSNGVKVSSDNVTFTDLSVVTSTAPTASYIDDAVAYTVIPQTVNGAYNGSAEVTINIPSTWDSSKVFGYAKSSDGTVTVLAGKASGSKFTFDTPNLTEIGIFEATDVDEVRNVTLMLELGETFSPITVSDSTNVGTAGTHTTANSSVSYTIDHTYVAGGMELDSNGIDSGSKYVIGSTYYNIVSTSSSSTNPWSTESLPINSVSVYGNADLSNYLWTITATTGGYYIQNPAGKYMVINKTLTGIQTGSNYTVTLSDTPYVCDITQSNSGYMIFADGTYIGLNNAGGANQTALGWNDTNNTVWMLYKQKAQSNTTVTFSALGITSGTTVTIGNINYNIIVESGDVEINTFLKLNSSETLDPLSLLGLSGDFTVTYEKISDENGAVVISGNTVSTTDVSGEATIVATVTNAAGEVVGTVTYTITVADVIITDTKNIYVAVGRTASISGLTGEIYDSAFNANYATYSESGGDITFTGVSEGNTTLVVGTVQLNVYVVPKNTSSSTTKYFYLNVEEIENCTVYCSINGSDLFKVNGEGVLIDQVYTDGIALILFAAPYDGYALTEISGRNIYPDNNFNPKTMSSDFFALRDGINDDGEIDVTLGSAWPLDAAGNYKNHGWQWMLKEGNITSARLKEVMEDAAGLGCDGASVITRNNSTNTTVNTEDDMDWDDVAANFSFKAEKLPTLTKKIIRYSRGGQTFDYTDDAKLMFGDVLTYQFTITAESTNIKFTNIVLDDSIIRYEKALADNLLNTAGSYTYTATYTIDKKDVALYTGGTFVNNANLTYNYKSTYSTGSYSGNASDSASCEIINLITYAWEEGTPEAIVNNVDGRFTLPETDYYSGTESFNTKVYTGETEYVVENGKWVLNEYWGIDWNGTRYYYYKYSVENTIQPAVGSRSFIFYGKWEFIPNDVDLTIKKTGYSAYEDIDPNQTFIFNVTGGGVDLTVTVHGEDQITVKGLTYGETYTVTEVTDWSWRYELDSWSFTADGGEAIVGDNNGAEITLGNTANEITFTNTREKDMWLDGDSFIVNIFKQIND